MYIFKVFQMLLMVVTWNNIEVDVPVHSSIDEYLYIPTAVLTEDGNVFHDPDMYYVRDAVDNHYLSDLETNYVGKIRYMIKAVFPNYGIESKQEIIFNIVDQIQPTITQIPNFTIQVGQKIPDVTVGLNYSDNYYLKDELTINILGLDTVNNKKIGKYYFTYQILDPSNNVETAVSFIKVIDTIPPEIIKLRDLKIELGETFDVYSFYKFSDNHDQFVNVSVNTSKVNFNEVGTYSISVKAQDSSNNETVTTDFLQITYTGKPVLNLYANQLNLEVGSIDYDLKLANNIKSVSDKINNLTTSDVDITHMININQLGKYEVEYKVSNSSGLETTKLINVNVVDTTKPQINLINELVLPYGTNSFIYQKYFNISDNYDDYPDLTITFTHRIDFKNIGEYPVKLEVTDRSKNKSVFEGVVEIVDLEPPIFITEDEMVEVSVFSSYNFETFKVSDNYDKAPTIKPKYVTFNELGVFEVVVTASDSSGNTNEKVVLVNVVDLEPPVISLSTNEITLSFGTLEKDYENYINSVSDNYDLLTIDDITIIDNVNYHELGKYEVLYKLVDNSGNEKIERLNVIINDTTKPKIELINDLVIPYGANHFIHQNYFLISDNYDDYSDLIVKFTYKIDYKALGEYPIKVEVTDTSKNKSVYEGVIRVVDLEPPTFMADDENIAVNVFSSVDFTNYTIEDNFDKNPIINPKSKYFNEVGTFEVVLVASDSSGNTTEKVVVIEVVDNEPPTIILSTNEIKLSIGSKKVNPRDYLLDAYDNYDELTLDDVQIIDNTNYHELGKYELIYYLTDSSGNEEYKIIEITIDDTTKPVIETQNQIIKYKSHFDVWDGVNVLDNDNNLTLKAYPNFIDTSQIGTYTITYIAIDSRGNIAKATRKIEVVDENENKKTALYVGINFAITGILTSTAFFYFKKKKRK
ncbi:MAG: immunoglobulin-like domain-containing protein [Acholeplasmataceae bacterium]